MPAPSCSFETQTHPNLLPITIPKSSEELTREISALESQILHLERYLLSLYRTAFQDRFPPSPNVPPIQWQCTKGPPSKVQTPQRGNFISHDPTSPAHASDDQSCDSSLRSSSTRFQQNSKSGRRSLADHLGPSSLMNSLNAPDRLSEEILKCISSIYCKLADTHVGFSSPPPSSLSSSSIFSSHHPCDSWSPQYSEDPVVKEEDGPYAAMLEVKKICLDDDSFNYAAAMLKHFRALVRSLENVNPMKMKREEKLAFWINIHNALVMHAYLAYGTRNRVKGASMLKAAYNIGGHCINASVIQSSIFGIRSHNSEPWLQALFSPGRKSKTGCIKHAYALEYPEPLVHFAICRGAYSDPAVRVYTARSIFEELKVAKEEFIQARARIGEAKISLPKIVMHYAKDMSMDWVGMLEAVSDCLREEQHKANIRKCIKLRRVEKCIQWLPQTSSFRYLFSQRNISPPL